MPINGPPVDQSFISAVSVCTWSAGALVNPLGATVHPYTSSGSAWVLASAGLVISDASFALLVGATAHDDGSFTAAGGTSYWLEVGFGSHGGFANAVAK